MAATNYYSASRVKRGLLHFATGRTLNGLGGFILLLLVVRQLHPVEYGAYVALSASLDVIALALSCGVFGFTQRYLPEFRIRGTPQLLLRSLAACLAIFFLALLAGASILLIAKERFMGLFQLPVSDAVFGVFAALVVIGGVLRWLEHVTESLLLQGLTQIAVMIRTWLKVAGLFALGLSSGFTLQHVLVLDLVGTAVAALVTLAAVVRIVMRSPTPKDASYRPDWKAIVRFSRQHYAALILAQVYGYSALKLLLSALAGPVATAAYGFAQSLVDMIRRYLPVHLLLGMVRPLIIAAYARGKDVARPIFLANLVFKLNVFLVLPVVAVAVPFGSELIELVHGGKYGASYPIFVCFLLILLLQTLHIVLSMLAMTLEQGAMILRGTVAACLGLLVAAVLIPHVGAFGAVAGAAVSECAYCLVLVSAIRIKYATPVLSFRGYARMSVLAAIASGVAFLVLEGLSLDGKLAAVVGGAIVVGLYFVFSRFWRPFSSEQRNALNRVLPRPVFVW